MSEFFWESTRRARHEHFCDYCCNYIEKGDTYRRWRWRTHRGSVFTMKCHESPDCPPNPLELEIQRERALEASFAIRQTLKLEEVLVVVQMADGTTTVESQTKLVTVTKIGQDDDDEWGPADDDLDDDIPF